MLAVMPWVIILAFVTNANCAASRRSGFKIVYVMVENRSYDHLFGAILRNTTNTFPSTFFNRVNNSVPDSEKRFFSPTASYINSCDPNHNTDITTDKIFGIRHAAAGNLSSPDMSGFVETELMLHKERARELDYCQVMSYFPAASDLPVLSFLASEFAVFDEYHCSVPGPTFPNRFFALTGTAAGLTSTGAFYRNEPGRLFPQTTLFEQLAAAGRSVALYYDGTPWELALRGVVHNPEMLRPYDAFLRDAAAGTLPDFSFLNPRAGVSAEGAGCNDFHPDHDVALGEAWLKEVYEAVRQGPAWPATVLLVTFDEHGGFADHVAPPAGVPPPASPWDAGSYPTRFAFDRLGVRVPLLVVSPLVPRGTVVSLPPDDAAKRYEHCSVLGTVRKLLGIEGTLTRRDAWAPTFEHVLRLPEPRDAPWTAPDAPPPSLGRAESGLAVNDLQWALVTAHDQIAAHLHPPHEAVPVRHQAHVLPAMRKAFASMLASIRTHDSAFDVVVAPWQKGVPANRFGDDTWRFEGGMVHSRALNISGTFLCLTRLEDDNVTAQLCRTVPRVDQQFSFQSDSTIRPLNDDASCLTVTKPLNGTDPSFIGVRRLVVAPCNDESVFQRFAYWGAAPGNEDIGWLSWGYLVDSIQLVKTA